MGLVVDVIHKYNIFVLCIIIHMSLIHGQVAAIQDAEKEVIGEDRPEVVWKFGDVYEKIFRKKW